MRLFILTIAILLSNYAPAQNANRQWSFEYLDSVADTHKGQPYIPFHLVSLDGKGLDNRSCLGKATFISFWFESCQGCVSEFPAINRLYDSISRDPHLQFIAVTFDHAQTLPSFIREHNIAFAVATTENRDTFKQLNFGMGCPGIIILDAKGRIAEIGMRGISENSDRNREFSIPHILGFMRSSL